MKYKSIEEINAIVLNDVIIEVMSRLLDLSDIPIGDQFYNLLPDEGQLLYDRIQVHISLVKPSLDDCEAELVLYKQELVENFDENAAEKERVELLEARFAALPDLRLCMAEAGFTDANAKKFQKDIIEEDRVADLEALEAVAATVQAQIDAASSKEAEYEAAMAYIQGLPTADPKDLIIEDVVLAIVKVMQGR